jgi:hypothetical protein
MLPLHLLLRLLLLKMMTHHQSLTLSGSLPLLLLLLLSWLTLHWHQQHTGCY